MIQSTVTNQFQITIPATIRRQLNIKAGDKLAFTPQKDKLTVTKIPKATDTQGALKKYAKNAQYKPGVEEQLWLERTSK